MAKLLPWRRCDCDCGAYCIELGSLHYWLFDAVVGDKRYHLYTGHHGTGDDLGYCTSLDEADERVRAHAKPRFEALRVSLDWAEGLINGER